MTRKFVKQSIFFNKKIKIKKKHIKGKKNKIKIKTQVIREVNRMTLILKGSDHISLSYKIPTVAGHYPPSLTSVISITPRPPNCVKQAEI